MKGESRDLRDELGMKYSVSAFERSAERVGRIIVQRARSCRGGRRWRVAWYNQLQRHDSPPKVQHSSKRHLALSSSSSSSSSSSEATIARTLVVVATYNEIENLPRLIGEIFQHAPDVDLLVIDDNSPDGTGRWCDEQLANEPRLKCLHRAGKLGLGSATLAGFRFAIEHDYEYVLTMDADFSHQPKHLPALRAGVESKEAKFDVMIGSRYVAGGGVEGWPLHRRLMSRTINTYARWMLGLRVNDCSGAFRCYRLSILSELDFDQIRSRGYSYLEEILWLLHRRKARFGETPITFVDRVLGQTKINSREAIAAVLLIFRLGLRQWFQW